MIVMHSISATRPQESTEKKAVNFQQLRLPLLRAEGRTGLLLANSPAADVVRRAVVKRLESGAIAQVAELIDRGVAYVYNQTSGESALTVDVLLASMACMSQDDARRVVQKLASAFGLFVIHSPSTALDDSAVSR